MTGTTGIQGRWFASVDTQDCQTRGKHVARECSLFVTPDPKAPRFPPTADLGMCAVGVAARAIAGADGTADWQNIFGARIGLTLNDGGPYDAPAHGVTGFAFHIDSEPPPNAGIRVEMETVSSTMEPALWGGSVAERSPVHAGHNEFRWADVGGPLYVRPPPRFDPDKGAVDRLLHSDRFCRSQDLRVLYRPSHRPDELTSQPTIIRASGPN